MDFAVLADHWVKIKEIEKGDKHLDLARELRKLWNMMVTVIQIVIGALGTVPKGFESGLEELKIGWSETIQTTVLLRSTRITQNLVEFTQNPVDWLFGFYVISTFVGYSIHFVQIISSISNNSVYYKYAV